MLTVEEKQEFLEECGEDFAEDLFKNSEEVRNDSFEKLCITINITNTKQQLTAALHADVDGKFYYKNYSLL